jgi:hypothetical protein
MDASTELNELWELLDKGRHEAWPECVERMGDGTFALELPETNHDSYADLDDRILHAIVRDSVEGWLVEQGWSLERTERGTCYTPNDYTLRFHSLPDAVRYAMGSTAAT